MAFLVSTFSQHINVKLLFCIEMKHQRMYVHITATGQSVVNDL